jgi:hypothetical protein
LLPGFHIKSFSWSMVQLVTVSQSHHRVASVTLNHSPRKKFTMLTHVLLFIPVVQPCPWITSMVSLKFPSYSPSSPAHHMGAFITRVQKLGQEKKFLARMHFTCPNINANFHSTIQAQLLLVQKRGRTRILRRLQPNLASGHRIISGPELVSTHLNLYSHDEPASHSDVTRNIEYCRLY